MLITFEGIDGSGKSTLAVKLCSKLKQAGIAVELSYEPGGTPLGEIIRSQLLSGSQAPVPKAEAMLYLTARAQLIEQVVGPALHAGRVVILDRFSDSTLAYQGYGRGLDLDFLRVVNREVTGGIQPRLTVLLDLDPREAAGRMARKKDRIEAQALDFHHRVRNGYLSLAAAEPARFFVVDASLAPEKVFGLVWERVRQELAAADPGNNPCIGQGE